MKVDHFRVVRYWEWFKATIVAGRQNSPLQITIIEGLVVTDNCSRNAYVWPFKDGILSSIYSRSYQNHICWMNALPCYPCRTIQLAYFVRFNRVIQHDTTFRLFHHHTVYPLAQFEQPPYPLQTLKYLLHHGFSSAQSAVLFLPLGGQAVIPINSLLPEKQWVRFECRTLRCLIVSASTWSKQRLTKA